jgi:hypothetical protein
VFVVLYTKRRFTSEKSTGDDAHMSMGMQLSVKLYVQSATFLFPFAATHHILEK